MTELPGGHAAFLAVALATHALVGYTLGRIAVDRPWVGLVGGVLADLDLLVPRSLGWPWAHRSVTHTALAGILVVALAYAVWRRRDVAVALGQGYASQLTIDLTTEQGIALLYPLSATHISVFEGGHSAGATAVLWAACLGVLWLYGRGSPATGDGSPWRGLADRLR